MRKQLFALVFLSLGASTCDQTYMDQIRCTVLAKDGQETLYKKVLKLSVESAPVEDKDSREIECIMAMNEELYQACQSGKLDKDAEFKKIANFKYKLHQNGMVTSHFERIKKLDDSCERYLSIGDNEEPSNQGTMSKLRCDLQVKTDSFLKRTNRNLTPSEVQVAEGVEKEKHVECVKAMNQWVFDTCQQVELPKEFKKRALLKYDLVKDGKIKRVIKTHEVDASCSDWGLDPVGGPSPEPSPTNVATEVSEPPRFPTPTGGAPNDFDRSKYNHLCPDGWMDRPAVPGMGNFGFYGRTGAIIPWAETRRYCAPIGEPLVPDEAELKRIVVTWGDDTDFECGALDVVVQQAFPPYHTAGPNWGTSGSVRFQATNRGVDCPSCVQRGVYIVTVHTRQLHQPANPRCSKFGLAWVPAYERNF